MSSPRQVEAPRVVVIGGGISGLAAAYQLTRQSEESGRALEVLLLEAGDRVGGTVRSFRRDGFLLEAGPDSFISEKPEALALARELCLQSRLIETNEAHRRSFIVRKGILRPVPEGFQLLAPTRFWPFVTTDIFSWPGKARMALDLLLPRRKPGANGADDESLAQFVRRRFGREALIRMAQPMVGGIYTADPEQLSLRATMPRFLDMEREHRSVIRALWRARRRAGDKHARGTSGARYSMFLSFDEGVQVLTDALAEALPYKTAPLEARPPTSRIRLNTRVRALSFDQSARQWHLLTDGGETITADAVCVALPAYAAAELLRATDAQLAAELTAIPYASTATVNLAYALADIPHPLDGFGFVVPFVERRATLACTFSSVKFAGRAPAGHALLRAFVGGALQPEMFALDEDAMTAAVCADLRALLGIEAPPLFAQVARWPRSMAQYHLGHAARVERIRARLSEHASLALCGNAYNGAGLPDCIRSGRAAADQLLQAVSTA